MHGLKSFLSKFLWGERFLFPHYLHVNSSLRSLGIMVMCVTVFLRCTQVFTGGLVSLCSPPKDWLHLHQTLSRQCAFLSPQCHIGSDSILSLKLNSSKSCVRTSQAYCLTNWTPGRNLLISILLSSVPHVKPASPLSLTSVNDSTTDPVALSTLYFALTFIICMSLYPFIWLNSVSSSINKFLIPQVASWDFPIALCSNSAPMWILQRQTWGP